jgi:hypothetical protein
MSQSGKKNQPSRLANLEGSEMNNGVERRPIDFEEVAKRRMVTEINLGKMRSVLKTVAMDMIGAKHKA